MAAHVKTVLEDIPKQLTEETRKLMIHGMNYAMWGGNLDYRDWRKFREELNNGSDDEVVVLVEELKVKYTVIWQDLGEPATAEEWMQARWGA